MSNEDGGELLFTDRNGQTMMFLIRNDRLLYARVISDSWERREAVYLGRVKKIVKNIGAAFVEIQKGESAYLPLSDSKYAFPTNRKADGRILEGDELPVQIVCRPMKTKQASVTAKLTITGKYGVVSSTDTGDIKVTDAKKTNRDKNDEEAREEINLLRETMCGIYKRAQHCIALTCLYPGKNPFAEAVEELNPGDFCEIITDRDEFLPQLEAVSDSINIPLRHYTDDYPLSSLYALDAKLENALTRRIGLKSGAYLIVDETEALTVFDVNSGSCDVRKASEETICLINREAAREVALQIRLRNLSGIILIDFINTESKKYNDQLISFMRKEVMTDRIHTKVVDITPLGLMEITRKRTDKTLSAQLGAKSGA